MNWLVPTHVTVSERDALTKVEVFVKENGELGNITIEVWNEVDPLHCLCLPDEYLGYAKRFVRGALGIVDFESWSKQPGLVEELVRRSFHPAQVVEHTSGFLWVTPEEIQKISRRIIEKVQHIGGWENLLPKS